MRQPKFNATDFSPIDQKFTKDSHRNLLRRIGFTLQTQRRVELAPDSHVRQKSRSWFAETADFPTNAEPKLETVVTILNVRFRAWAKKRDSSSLEGNALGDSPPCLRSRFRRRYIHDIFMLFNPGWQPMILTGIRFVSVPPHAAKYRRTRQTSPDKSRC